MAVLNLRNVPEDLMRELRKGAVDAGLGLHDYCRAVLARGVDMKLGQPVHAKKRNERAEREIAEMLKRRDRDPDETTETWLPKRSGLNNGVDRFRRPSRQGPAFPAVKVEIT